MSGTIHPYYAVALAPGLAGTLAIGGQQLWRRREHLAARMTLAIMVAATASWSVVLLRRSPEFLPWLRWVVAVAGVIAVVSLVVRAWRWRRAVPVLVLAALLAGAGGATAYALETAGTAHQGSIVSAGPSTSSDSGHGGGHGGPGAPGGAPGGRGGPGGVTTSAALTSMLTSAGTRWSAATVSAQSASSLELSSGTAVMAIGGFAGTDAAPSLAQFQAYVAAGDIHWFVASGQGGGPGGGRDGVGGQITAWVQAHFHATTVDGATVYDLTSPTTG